MKLVKYSEECMNIGDAMQTVALKDFILSKYGIDINEYSDRNNMTEDNMIINGWHRNQHEKLPENGIFIGLHSDSKKLTHLKNDTLIGCRDLFTLNEVKKIPHLKGIFSACSTCVIPKYTGPRKGKAEYLHADMKTGVIPFDKQIEMVRNLIDELKTKELVTTDRLHIALPCIALGTPVIMKKRSYQRERYSLFDLVPSFIGFGRIIKPNSGIREYFEKIFTDSFEKIVVPHPNFQKLLNERKT
jgi:hypothetical protein